MGYRHSVLSVAAAIHATLPEHLTPAAIAAWAESASLANNTVRKRITSVRTFMRWAVECGHVASYRDAPLTRLLRSYPPVYGKAQGKRPAVRLSKTQLDDLIAACQDGTDPGLRDEVYIRLTVAGGMRVNEARTLTVADLTRTPGVLTWSGKANKQRTAHLGPALLALTARYLDTYEARIGRPLEPSDPLYCRKNRSRQVQWGERFEDSESLGILLARRCAAAGLPAMAPHDLKRTTARIMHEARTADGGHLFDLADIADVLDHSNPVVTSRCYIGPLGNANKDRAADLFD